MVETELESRFIENNPLKQLKKDHLINKIAMGITALGGASLLIYGLFAGDSEIAKINSYIESTRISASIGSAVVFAITAFEYFSIYKPMVERIENYESILGQNSFLRQD